MRSLLRRRTTPEAAAATIAKLLADRPPETLSGAELMASLVERPTWCVDAVELSDDRCTVTVRGWAIARSPTTRLEVAIDGVEASELRRVQRPDLARLFWYLPHASGAGFELSSAIGGAHTSDYLRMSLVVDGVIDEDADYSFPLGKRALPGAAHRRRVHGSEDAASFLLEGCSAFHKLRTSLQRVGRELEHARHILDWGCGCGRLTYHLATLADGGTEVTGIDVDATNVDWAARHLRFGRFELVDTAPPTSLRDGCYDLIIGISVFSHLRERDQIAWLNELRRLVADDGLAWVTVHGPTTVARSGVPSAGVRKWLEAGFADVGTNFDIEGAVADAQYYRNVFHTHQYIRRVWSRWFEIVDIVPGYVGNNQDLVMMRPA